MHTKHIALVVIGFSVILCFLAGCGDNGAGPKPSKEEGTLLVRTSDGLIAVSLAGEKTLLNSTTGEVEVLESRIFIGPGGAIAELDHEGTTIRYISRPSEIPWATTFVVLPDTGFAFVNNVNDSIYFMDVTGAFVTADYVVEVSPENLQSTKGITIDNRLIMADSGPDKLFEYDLATHEGTELKDFSGLVSTFDVDYDDGTFFVCGTKSVYRFADGGDIELLSTMPDGNVLGIAVVGSYAYTITNFTGQMHRIDLETGDYALFVDGLNYPQDIEYIPVEIEGDPLP